MMNIIKKCLRKIILREKCDSETYVNYLRKKGCKIGEGTVFFKPNHVEIDSTRPWLINIGKNVQITKDVTILTHGYDWSVIKGKYGTILGSSGKVVIGNNVFIGMKSTILKGVKISDNVIIGANSLVNKDIPDNVVVAGNPAKIIMSLDDYYCKRKNAQESELFELIDEYFNTFKEFPSKKILREFIFSFEDRGINVEKDEVFSEIASLLGNFDETKENFYNSKGSFASYDDLKNKWEKRKLYEKK